MRKGVKYKILEKDIMQAFEHYIHDQFPKSTPPLGNVLYRTYFKNAEVNYTIYVNVGKQHIYFQLLKGGKRKHKTRKRIK